jgi:crotonobetainyl-CoA:carnitine CoA-transferase CaiB-like acyl-CoA transferase
VTAYFSCCNLGKKSMALDIREPEALSIVHQLAAKADVVVASYKPGDAEKLGVDEHTLRSLNPRLIYAQITGYGLDDPRAGYDAVIQAESGFQCATTFVF